MEHPELCYVAIQSTNEIGIVKWGENGYYKTDLDIEPTDGVINHLNEKLGLSVAEMNAMKICSMVNPESWESHYNMVLKAMIEKGV